jgi:hypothetical protein
MKEVTPMADDNLFFDLPVFTEPQKSPEPVPYEVAVRAFEEIAAALQLREQPRPAEDIPEFKM